MATMKGCPHCGASMETTAEVCQKCQKGFADALARPRDEFELMQRMTESQRLLFSTQMNGVRKQASTGVLLAALLGGIGAHHFYLGNTIIGVLYLVFFWTFIPSVIGLLEAFAMPGRVRDYNNDQANRIASMVGALESKAS